MPAYLCRYQENVADLPRESARWSTARVVAIRAFEAFNKPSLDGSLAPTPVPHSALSL